MTPDTAFMFYFEEKDFFVILHPEKKYFMNYK